MPALRVAKVVAGPSAVVDSVVEARQGTLAALIGERRTVHVGRDAFWGSGDCGIGLWLGSMFAVQAFAPDCDLRVMGAESDQGVPDQRGYMVFEVHGK